MNKYKVGDKVVLRRDSQRTPKWILRGLRLNTPRTIQVVFYNKPQQHTFYYFGCNGKSKLDISYIPFRATQLKVWENRGVVGRPKKKWGEKTRDRIIANAIYNAKQLKAEKALLEPIVKKKKQYKRNNDSGYSKSAKTVGIASKCTSNIKPRKRFKQYSDIRSTTRGFNECQSKYIFERDNATCVYCGVPAEEIDHVVSWKDGGQTIVSNGVCSCIKCNHKKIHHLSIEMLTRAIYWLMQKGEDMSWTDSYIKYKYGKHTNQHSGAYESLSSPALNKA